MVVLHEFIFEAIKGVVIRVIGKKRHKHHCIRRLYRRSLAVRNLEDVLAIVNLNLAKFAKDALPQQEWCLLVLHY